MGTFSITAAGFANTPATPPANWPVGVAYPANGVVNGTKTYTISDADWMSLLTWCAATTVTPNPSSPTVIAAGLILLNWVNIWITGSQTAVQQYNVTPAVVPPKITFT